MPPKVKRLATKKIHPNSRTAIKISKKEHQKQRALKSKQETKKKDNLLIQRIQWFKTNAGDLERVLTNEEINDLMEKYILRFNEELEQIQLKNNIGKRVHGQHFGREQSISITLEMEKNELASVGMEIPELNTEKSIEFLRKWDGEANLLPLVKLIRWKLSDEQLKQIDSKIVKL